MTDSYNIAAFAEEAHGNELAWRILNTLRVAAQDVAALKRHNLDRELAWSDLCAAVRAPLKAANQRAAHHRKQRKIWQRRCVAVFRQAHGRKPTVEELEALVTKDWRTG